MMTAGRPLYADPRSTVVRSWKTDKTIEKMPRTAPSPFFVDARCDPAFSVSVVLPFADS